MARTVRMKRKREDTVSAGTSEEETIAPVTKKMKDLPKRSSTRAKKPTADSQEIMRVAATTAAEDAEVSSSDTAIDIWIGISTQGDQTNGTIGVYYGKADDERNWTGRPELEIYNADDAYVWAATQAIERVDNDATRIVIYTECSTLGDAKEGDVLREQLHARISQRSGTTQFEHAVPSTSLKLQKAHELARAATKEKVIEELGVETIAKDEPMEIDGSAAAEEEEKTPPVPAYVDAEKAEDADTTTDKAPSTSWRPPFGLRNILEILKAPFVKGTRTV